MRYWINTLQVVSINDEDTIKELETFIRYPNGTYRKKNDTYYDDRVMSLVWTLFILETEICQQYFEISSFDEQNKPLTLVTDEYSRGDASLYILGNLVENHTEDPALLQNNTQEKYTPFITFEEISKIEEEAILDMDMLLSAGYKPL
jgi:hypothetical protein